MKCVDCIIQDNLIKTDSFVVPMVFVLTGSTVPFSFVVVNLVPHVICDIIVRLLVF